MFKDPLKTACFCTQNLPLRIILALSLSKNVPDIGFKCIKESFDPLNT